MHELSDFERSLLNRAVMNRRLNFSWMWRMWGRRYPTIEQLARVVNCSPEVILRAGFSARPAGWEGLMLLAGELGLEPDVLGVVIDWAGVGEDSSPFDDGGPLVVY
jgi:hypothetical protein